MSALEEITAAPQVVTSLGITCQVSVVGTRNGTAMVTLSRGAFKPGCVFVQREMRADQNVVDGAIAILAAELEVLVVEEDRRKRRLRGF